jgi:hypothetical protein
VDGLVAIGRHRDADARRDLRVDTLFRADRTAIPPLAPDARAEAARIIVRGLAAGEFPRDDRAHLAQLVMARASLAEPEAQRRVEAVVRQVQAADRSGREATDRARRAAAITSIILALSLFVGAFIASVAAAHGGRMRVAP